MSLAAVKSRVKALRKVTSKLAEVRRVFALLPEHPIPEGFDEARGDRLISIEILGEPPRDFGEISAVRRIVFQRPQADAMFCDHDEAAYVGGLGSGKSWALARACLAVCIWELDTLHLVTMATLEHARDSVIPEFERALHDFGFVEGEDFWWRRKDSGGRPNLYLRANGKTTVVRFRGSDNHESLRGPEVGDLWIDEMRGCDPEGLKVARNRVRCPKAKKLRMRGSTTPNGYDSIHNRYVVDFDSLNRYEVKVKGRDVPVSIYEKSLRSEDFDDDGNPAPIILTMRLVNTSTDANAFVRSGYAASISTDTDVRRVRQERGGEFLPPATVFAHAFNREANVRACAFDPALDVFVGQDFNVGRNLSIFAHLVTLDDGWRELRVFGELKAKDTIATGEVIGRRFEKGRGRVVIVPDPAGGNRDSRSRTSDHEILRKAVPRATIRRFRALSHFDSANNLNTRLCDGDGRIAIVVDPSCTELIRDLGEVEWDDGGERIKKHTSGPKAERTHALDGLRYLVDVLMPVGAGASSAANDWATG